MAEQSTAFEDPTDDARQRAARLHLSGLALGLLLPIPWRARRREEGFLKHHAHQALCLQLTLLILEGVHGVLHYGIWRVRWFLALVTEEVGDPPPAWMLEALGWAHTVNWVVMALEVTAALVMSIYMARRARAGHAPEYPFAWPAEPPSHDPPFVTG